jgi:urease gamma subunit
VNSKQRRQRKRQAIRILEAVVNISAELLEEVKDGVKTIDEAQAELLKTKEEIKAL